MVANEARAHVAPIPDWWPKFAGLRMFGRIVSGRRVYGGKRAGWWTNGRVAALRWSVFGWIITAVGLLIWGLFLQGFTLRALLLLEVWVGFWLAVGAVMLGRFLFRLIKNWWLRDRILNPLHIALHKPEDLVGWPEDERPSRYLHVPLNWDKGEGAKVTIELRPGYANTDLKRDHFIEVVSATMGATIKPVDVSWRQSGKRPFVTIHPSWPPPKLAWFADNLERIEAARKPGEIVWGICDHDKLLKTSVTGETPHGAVVGQTGRGKSQTLVVGACQLMHDGMANVVLDVKGRSLPCFIDLPNAEYAGDVEEVDELLLKLETEFYRRRDLMKTWKRGEERPDIGVEVLITVDESDSTFKALRALHARRGHGRNSVPSIDAFIALRNMGRQYKMRMLRGTQSGSAAAAGSGDSRSMDGWSLVSGDKPTWQKVSRDITKPPPISPIVGRWHLYRNGVIREVQIFGFPDPPKGTNIEEMEEARDYAMSGIVTPVPDCLKLRNVPPSVNPSEASTAGLGSVPWDDQVPSQVGHLRLVPDQPVGVYRMVSGDRPRPLTSVVEEQPPPPVDRLLTLQQALDERVVTRMKWEALRKAVRGKVLPVGGAVPYVYRESELRALDATRERSNA